MADHLLEHAPALCGNPALASSPTLCEAAQGVAAILAEQQTVPHEVDPHTACTLMSRALEASGESSLARRLHLAGTSSVYAASWITAGRDTVWTLDVRKLAPDNSPCMELVLFERLRVWLTDYADVWDATGGRGVVGLKGLSDVAASILGTLPAAFASRLLAAELRDYCASLLDRQRRQRGWHSTPLIMSVDA